MVLLPCNFTRRDVVGGRSLHLGALSGEVRHRRRTELTDGGMSPDGTFLPGSTVRRAWASQLLTWAFGGAPVFHSAQGNRMYVRRWPTAPRPGGSEDDSRVDGARKARVVLGAPAPAVTAGVPTSGALPAAVAIWPPRLLRFFSNEVTS